MEKQPPRHKDTELEEINQVTEQIIGCAIEVHREVQIPAVYKGKLLGHYRVDFIVANLVIVEVKSVERMNPVFETQVITYLRLTKKRIGLLVNFNSRLVRDGVKRLIV